MPISIEIFEYDTQLKKEITIFGPQQYDTDPQNPKVPTPVLERALIAVADIPYNTTVFGTRTNITDAFDGKDIQTLTQGASIPSGVTVGSYYIDTDIILSNATGLQENVVFQSNRPYPKNPTILYGAVVSSADLAYARRNNNGELPFVTPDPRPSQQNIFRRGVLRII